MQPFTGCLPISPRSRSDCRLCVSKGAGPSLCRLPFREETGGQGGAQRSLWESAGAPSGRGRADEPEGLFRSWARREGKGQRWDAGTLH